MIQKIIKTNNRIPLKMIKMIKILIINNRIFIKIFKINNQ